MLLAPEEVAPLAIRVALPANLPAGVYRGALLLQGFREGSIPVEITVKVGPGSKKDPGRKSMDAKVSPGGPGIVGGRTKKRGQSPARRK
jgi:hypothetical protein